AHLRVNAVGADDEVRPRNMAVGKARFRVLGRLADGDALFAKRNRVRLQPLHRLGQNAEEVAAMQHDVRRAVAFGRRRAEIEPVPGFAAAPVPYLARGRNDLNAGQGVAQAERIEDTGAVRAELDAGADLLEHGRLLVHLDIDAALEQRQRRGESADAAANDDDFGRRRAGDPLHIGTPAGLLRVSSRLRTDFRTKEIPSLEGRDRPWYGSLASPPRHSARCSRRRRWRNPIRTGRFTCWSRFRRAAAPISWHVCSGNCCRRASGRAWWWRTGRAPTAMSRATSSRARPPTAI